MYGSMVIYVIKAALRVPRSPDLEIVICFDNIAAASCLRGKPSDSSQDDFIEFQALADAHGAASVRWVPGHAKILGNEEADGPAKAGRPQPVPADALPTLAYIRRAARQRPKDVFAAWWSESAPDQYKPLELSATSRCPPELILPRRMLHHLLAARTRHGDYADYHESLEHADAEILCSCGRRKAPDHIFYCRKIPPRFATAPDQTGNKTFGGGAPRTRQELERIHQGSERQRFLREGLLSLLGTNLLTHVTYTPMRNRPTVQRVCCNSLNYMLFIRASDSGPLNFVWRPWTVDVAPPGKAASDGSMGAYPTNCDERFDPSAIRGRRIGFEQFYVLRTLGYPD